MLRPFLLLVLFQSSYSFQTSPSMPVTGARVSLHPSPLRHCTPLLVLPTFGLTERERARFSAMRLTSEPLVEEMGGVILLMGMLGAKLGGPLGFLLGSTQVAPSLILCEAPRSSTSPVLGAGWHVWHYFRRTALAARWLWREARRRVTKTSESAHPRAMRGPLAIITSHLFVCLPRLVFALRSPGWLMFGSDSTVL